MKIGEILNKYRSEDPEYHQTIMTALYNVETSVLEEKLAEAEEQGKKIEIIEPEEGKPGEPYGVRIAE